MPYLQFLLDDASFYYYIQVILVCDPELNLQKSYIIIYSIIRPSELFVSFFLCVSSSFDGHNEDGTLDMHDDAAPNGYTPTMKANGGDARMFSRHIPVWLSDSTPDEFVVCFYSYSRIVLELNLILCTYKLNCI